MRWGGGVECIGVRTLVELNHPPGTLSDFTEDGSELGQEMTGPDAVSPYVLSFPTAAALIFL